MPNWRLPVVILSAVGAGLLLVSTSVYLGVRARSLPSSPAPRVLPNRPPAASPPLRLAAPRSTPSPSPGLPLEFLNTTYRYSFRYPEKATVAREDDDHRIILRRGQVPLLLFTITTEEAEQAAIAQAVHALQETLTHTREHLLEPAARGQPAHGAHGVPFACLETRRLGFAVNVGISCERPDIYVSLRGGHVLRIEEPEPAEPSPERTAVVASIISSLNPFR